MNLISLYRKNKRKSNIRKNKQYMDISSESIYGDNFWIDVRKPSKKVYLKIGTSSYVNGRFIFEKETGQISIGERVHIGESNFISIDSIEIGNDVTIAWGCLFYDHNSHSVNWNERAEDTLREIEDIKLYGNPIKNKDWSVVKHKPIIIKDKVWIGADCKILKGVTIGEGAVIGAGSVVTQDIKAWTVAAGNPAKIIREIK